MARVREITTSDFGDLRLAGLGARALLLWLALRTVVDDRGVVEWSWRGWTRRFPLLESNMPVAVEKLKNAGMLKRFEVGGVRYVVLADFAKDHPVVRPRWRCPLPEELWEFAGWSKELEAIAQQHTGRGRPGGKRLERQADLLPTDTAAAPKPEKVYAFAGAVLKLTTRDFEKWRAEYSKVPDFAAALRACDDWLSSERAAGRLEGKSGWFFAAKAYMAKRQQEWAARPSPGRLAVQHPNSVAAILRRAAGGAAAGPRK